MKLTVKILLIVVLSVFLCGQAVQQKQAKDTRMTDAQLLEKVESFVTRLASEDKFSGALLVAKENVPILKKAYGLASKGYNVPNRFDTKFNLGSMNKMFTGVAIAQLALVGKLSFSDTVGKLLPDYPNKQVAQKVTVHHLLTHTSGMGNYFNDKFSNSSRQKFREVRDYFPLFVDEPLQFEPGSGFRYSNSGFMVLGAIIEQVSGQDYFDYIRDHVYKPALMSNSDSYELDRDIPNLAIGYTHSQVKFSGSPSSLDCCNQKSQLILPDDGEWRNNIFMHVLKGGPAGGGYSTVEDLLRFATALTQHKLLSPKYTEILLTGKFDVPAPAVGVTAAYGFFVERQANGQHRVGHAGGFLGINSQLDIYPELGYVVAVMSNYDPPKAQQVSDYIGKLLQGASSK